MVRSGSSAASFVLGGCGYVSSVGVCGAEEFDGMVEPRDKIGGDGDRGGAARALRGKLRMERRRRIVLKLLLAEGEGEGARSAMLSRSSCSASSSISSEYRSVAGKLRAEEGGRLSTREGVRKRFVRMIEPRRARGGDVPVVGAVANVACVLWLDAKTSCA